MVPLCLLCITIRNLTAVNLSRVESKPTLKTWISSLKRVVEDSGEINFMMLSKQKRLSFIGTQTLIVDCDIVLFHSYSRSGHQNSHNDKDFKVRAHSWKTLNPHMFPHQSTSLIKATIFIAYSIPSLTCSKLNQQK